MLALVRQAPHAIANNARVALRDVADFAPDLVVTDFDSFAHLVGAALRIPTISVDHQPSSIGSATRGRFARG
jgi:hypothetical protein